MRDEHFLDEARAVWESRYDARGPMAVEYLAAALRRDEDFVTWDPGGPYLGVDGAHYQPGALCFPDADEPVLIIEGRGACEVITGWADFGQMQEWIARRGTGGSRELTAPPVPALTRTWLEDTVLAYAVNHPVAAEETLRVLEPDAMTTDVRYDVLDAVRRLSGRGTGHWPPETISAEARERLGGVPLEGLGMYGGPGGPFIRTYVSRLAETVIREPDVRSAIRTLHMEDRQARRRATLPVPPGQRDRQPREQCAPPAVMTPGTCPVLPQGHVPGPQPGPVRGR